MSVIKRYIVTVIVLDETRKYKKRGKYLGGFNLFMAFMHLTT
jgi:hypothetical protein